MSSSLLFDFREIIEPARICSSYPRGVAPGSCTAPRTTAPDKLLCTSKPHPHHQYPALKLWHSPDLRCGPKLFWWPHMLQPPHVMMHQQPAHTRATPCCQHHHRCMAWHISCTTLYCILIKIEIGMMLYWCLYFSEFGVGVEVILSCNIE